MQLVNLYSVISIITTAAILLAYVNYRFIQMQATIAMLVASLCISFGILFLGNLGFMDSTHHFANFMQHFDFYNLLINGLLSFLLFAGALNIDIRYLQQHKWEVATLASFSTLLSTFIVGLLIYYILNFFQINIGFVYCLLFGALISPTDPIAVLAIFKKLKASQSLHTLVECESLFNDGVAIVIFLTIFHFAYTDNNVTTLSVLTLFAHQSLGGIIFGIVLGIVAYRLIRPINNSHLEVLMTLTIPTGGYAIANLLGFSGPLAMVVAGIFIGNSGDLFSVRGRTKENLRHFWSLIDEVLNAILFMLMGLELLVINVNRQLLFVGICATMVVLLARFVTVAIPMSFFKLKKSYSPNIITILTWGGLRGGLAVALALSLPKGENRDLIISMTYAVVIFSIIVQGLTIKNLIQHSQKNDAHHKLI